MATPSAPLSPAIAPRRGPWVQARLRELPSYTGFLYNTLIDRRLSWECKEIPFAALRYVFHDDPEDFIPAGDTALSLLDDLAVVLGASADLVACLPEGFLCQSEQFLAMQGVSLREAVAKTPEMLGAFFTKIHGYAPSLRKKHRPSLGNALQTGALLQRFSAFLGEYKPPAFSEADLQRIESFLEVFR